MSADRLIKVPAGTKPTLCTGHAIGGSCKQPVFWVRDRYGVVPVDCDGPDCQRPSESKDRDQADLFSGTAQVRDGFGHSHSAVCPDRALFAERARMRAAG